jgi:hypothetical protein
MVPRFRTVNREGVSIFMVEQNASLALEIAHEAFVLQTGRIVLSGPARSLKDDPRVRDAYLGGADTARIASPCQRLHRNFGSRIEVARSC